MIQQTYCNIFAKNILLGAENFSGTSPYQYKIALYDATASLGPTTLAYTPAGEITGSGYTAGGLALTIVPALVDQQNNTAYFSFQNATWDPASFTARGALVYNSTTGAACFVLDFGSDKTATNSFTVTFPVADSTNAVLRIN